MERLFGWVPLYAKLFQSMGRSSSIMKFRRFVLCQCNDITIWENTCGIAFYKSCNPPHTHTHQMHAHIRHTFVVLQSRAVIERYSINQSCLFTCLCFIVQKSKEVLEEALLSLTLNNLRKEGENSCTGFIETIEYGEFLCFLYD